MEPFVALILVGIALESFVQLIKNAWDAEARSNWSVTRFLVVLIPILAAFNSSTNLVADSGLDFGQDALGYLISGLVVGRIAQWVHDIYKRTA